MQRKFRIIAGSQDQATKPAIRDARASILRNGTNDVALTPIDQYVGDRFAESHALRDRVKMVLVLMACAEGNIRIAKHARLTENRTRYGNIVVERQCPNQYCRSIQTNRDMFSELNPRLHLDHSSERLEHLIEELDLLVRIVSGTSGKQIGYAHKCLYLSFCRLRQVTILNFAEERIDHAHFGTLFRVTRIRWEVESRSRLTGNV